MRNWRGVFPNVNYTPRRCTPGCITLISAFDPQPRALGGLGRSGNLFLAAPVSVRKGSLRGGDGLRSLL